MDIMDLNIDKLKSLLALTSLEGVWVPPVVHISSVRIPQLKWLNTILSITWRLHSMYSLSIYQRILVPERSYNYHTTVCSSANKGFFNMGFYILDNENHVLHAYIAPGLNPVLSETGYWWIIPSPYPHTPMVSIDVASEFLATQSPRWPS